MGDKLTIKQAEIIKALQEGKSKALIVKELRTTYPTIARTVKQHGDLIEQANEVSQVNIDNWETDLAASLKRLTLHIANVLASKNLQKQSAPQLTTALGTCFDKLRLIENKATSITQTRTQDMSDEQRKILQELSDKYHENLRARLKRVK
jgi:hypothetical protein